MHRQTFAGDTVMTMERTHTRVPVTSEERDEAVENMRWFTQQGGRVDASRIPGHKPAFSRFTIAPDGHRYLRQVRAPWTSIHYPVFRDGRLYGATSDSLGVQYVVRLRIAEAAHAPRNADAGCRHRLSCQHETRRSPGLLSDASGY